MNMRLHFHRKYAFVGAVLCMVLAAGCGTREGDDVVGAPSVTSDPANQDGTVRATPLPRAVEATEWQEFASAAGKFTILTPGVLTESTSTTQTVLGAMPSHDFLLKAKHGSHVAAYMMSYCDYPDGGTRMYKPEDFLERCYQGAYGNAADRLIAKRNMTVNGYAAQDFQMHGTGNSKMLINFRNVLVGDRMYQLSTVMMPELVDAGYATRFLDSFKPSP